LRVRKKSLPVILGLDESPEFRRRWDDESRDEGAIRAMVRLLEQAGIRSRALERADVETRQALEALGGAAPAEPAATELASLTARLLHRTT
jgi:geranylgeranyl pyrophosphate synthase